MGVSPLSWTSSYSYPSHNQMPTFGTRYTVEIKYLSTNQPWADHICGF